MTESFTSIVARLVNIVPWNVYQFNDVTKDVEPFFEVTGQVIHDLVIKEHNLLEQRQTVTGMIAHWGRWSAQAKRVWEAVEHNYRIWRDTKSLEFVDPEGKPDDWKKPTIAQVDQMIRTHPEYEDWYIAQERAEEAYNATVAVYEAFRAKAKLLQPASTRQTENSAPTYGY